MINQDPVTKFFQKIGELYLQNISKGHDNIISRLPASSITNRTYLTFLRVSTVYLHLKLKKYHYNFIGWKI